MKHMGWILFFLGRGITYNFYIQILGYGKKYTRMIALKTLLLESIAKNSLSLGIYFRSGKVFL